MCFGGGGPSAEEKKAAAASRTEAEQAKRSEIEAKARIKRDSISSALTGRESGASPSGGTGRRSLLSSGAHGYASRFE